MIAAQKPLFEIDWWIFTGNFSGQSIILLLGGIFLIYKSTSEIHHKIEGEEGKSEAQKENKRKLTFSNAVSQIMLINIVFSIDSILTAIGMTNGVENALPIMIISVVLSMIIMMLFANQVSNFVVSPNPVTTSFSVKYNGNTSNYEIFDVLGKSVQKGNIENGQQIEINKLNKGVYFLNLKSETFNENKKIIIN